MIIFATAYDDATAPNHRMAVALHSQGDIFLEKEEATREALHLTLASSVAPLIVFSHGTAELVRAHGGKQNAAALTHEDPLGTLLKGRPVFAHACETARVLGRSAAISGTLWWGYLEKVTTPSDIPGIREILLDLFRYVKASFARPAAQTSVDQFFSELRERCGAAKDALYDITVSDPDIPYMDAYQLVEELESKLVAWVPGATEPYKPPLVSS